MTNLGDDLLNGAAEIARYLGWSRRRVYYASERGYLPIAAVGAKLIARPSELDRALSGHAKPPDEKNDER